MIGEPDKPITKALVYELKEKARGWFDVVNSEGKAFNTKALRKSEAIELKKKLAGS